MLRTANILFIASLGMLLASSCSKPLDAHATVTSVKLLSYENRTWNLTSGPNIYCVLTDSPLTTTFFSTIKSYIPDVQPYKLPISWDLSVQIPSSGRRFVLQLINKEETASQLMETIYFYIDAPKDLSSHITTVKKIQNNATTAEITVQWN